jgi:hypothetical protein
MARQRPLRSPTPPRMSRDALKRVLQDVDDARLDRILALHPTPSDVEEAVLWLDGKTQRFLGHNRLPAAATIGIVGILVRDEEEERPA